MTFTDQVLSEQAVWQTIHRVCDKCGIRYGVQKVFVTKGQPSAVTARGLCHRCSQTQPRRTYAMD